MNIYSLKFNTIEKLFEFKKLNAEVKFLDDYTGLVVLDNGITVKINEPILESLLSCSYYTSYNFEDSEIIQILKKALKRFNSENIAKSVEINRILEEDSLLYG